MTERANNGTTHRSPSAAPHRGGCHSVGDGFPVPSLPLEGRFPPSSGGKCLPGWLVNCACREFRLPPLENGFAILLEKCLFLADKRGASRGERSCRALARLGDTNRTAVCRATHGSGGRGSLCGSVHSRFLTLSTCYGEWRSHSRGVANETHDKYNRRATPVHRTVIHCRSCRFATPAPTASPQGGIETVGARFPRPRDGRPVPYGVATKSRRAGACSRRFSGGCGHPPLRRHRKVG